MSIIYINPYQFAAAAAYDPDAQSYITAVEAADGQPLETGVRDAINGFVVGCKADGIWDAIKASCIMAGARTLAGALVPLVGTAPTNYNFVEGDYDRETGLAGDGSTKYLDSNRNHDADPQNNFHLSIFVSNAGSGTPLFAGALDDITAYGSQLGSNNLGSTIYHRANSGSSAASSAAVTNLVAVSRSNYAEYDFISGSTIFPIAVGSNAPPAKPNFIFARNYSASISKSNARLAFYSIGESLDLALLDARVTDLITAIGVAIP